MTEAPFYPLPYDVVLRCVLPKLNVRDLGRLSQTSKTHYEYLLHDEAWAHVKARCLEAVPLWGPNIFDRFPWKAENSSTTKRHKGVLGASSKRSWKPPHGGTRHVLKTYVGKIRDAHSVRKLMGSPSSDSNVFNRTSIEFDRRRLLIHNERIYLYREKLAKVSAVAGIGVLANSDDEYRGCINERNDNGLVMRAICHGEPVVIWNKRAWYLKNRVPICESTPGFRKLFWF